MANMERYKKTSWISLFTSAKARIKAQVSIKAKNETESLSRLEAPTREEKSMKKVKTTKETLPPLQLKFLLQSNHRIIKAAPKAVAKPSRTKIVSTMACIFSKKPNATYMIITALATQERILSSLREIRFIDLTSPGLPHYHPIIHITDP